jgi:predicted acyltransferase
VWNFKGEGTEKFLYFFEINKNTKEHIKLWYKIIKRTFLLFLIGVLLGVMGRGFVFWRPIRIFGVLQRISICYIFVTCLTILVTNFYHKLFIILPLQFLYLFVLFGVEVPNCGRGSFTQNCNAASYFDRLIITRPFMRVIYI